MAGVDMLATHYLLIGFSSVTLCVNLPVVTFILVHPKLRRSKEVILICLVCFADMANALSYFCLGIHRLSLILKKMENSTTINHECAHYFFSWLLCACYQLVGLSIISISADRFIAVMLPTRYRRLPVSYAYGMFGGSLTITAVGVAVCGVIWVRSPPLVISAMCYAASAYTPEIFTYMVACRTSLIATGVVLYVPIGVRVYRLVKSLSKSAPKEQQNNRALIKTTLVVGITLTFEFTLVLLPDIILKTNFLGLREFQMVGALLVCTKGFVNIFLYTCKTEEIRRSVLSGLMKHGLFGRALFSSARVSRARLSRIEPSSTAATRTRSTFVPGRA